MKNMKIEITKKQSLDDVNFELARLGFERTYYSQTANGRWLKTSESLRCEITTLAELKEMRL